MAPTALKSSIARHSDAAGYLQAFLLAVAVSGIVLGAIQYDRRAPLVYLGVEIVPTTAHIGGDITVRRYVEWRRICYGQTHSEIVTPKGYVLPREAAIPNTPERPGYAISLTQIALPADLLTPSDTIGTAVYRGSVRFSDCGITSRFWPLTVEIPERTFDVRR